MPLIQDVNPDVLIWLGVGHISDLGSIPHETRAVLVDINPSVLKTLEKQSITKSNIIPVLACLAAESGEAEFYHYNLKEYSAFSKVDGLRQLFPGIKLKATEILTTTAVADFIRSQSLQTQNNTLRIDIIDQCLHLLRALADSELLYQFNQLQVQTSDERLYKGSAVAQDIIQFLNRHGYELQTKEATDPDIYKLYFVLNTLWRPLQNVQEQQQKVQDALEFAKQELIDTKQQAKQEHSELTKKAAVVSQIADQAKKDLNTAKQELALLKRAVEEIGQQLVVEKEKNEKIYSELTKEATVAKQIAEKANNEADLVKIALEAAKKEVTVAKQETITIKKTLEDTGQQLVVEKQKNERTHAELIEQIAEAKQAAEQAKNQEDAAKQELVSLRMAAEETQQQLVAEKEKNERTHAELIEQIAEAKQTAEQAKNQEDAAKQELVSLRKAAEETQQQLVAEKEKNEKIYLELTEEATVAKQNAEKANNEADLVKIALEAAKKEINTAKQETITIKKGLEDARQQLIDEKQELTDELILKRTEYKNKCNEIHELSLKYKEQVVKHEEKTNLLITQIDGLKKQTEQSEKTRADLQGQISKCAEELEITKKELCESTELVKLLQDEFIKTEVQLEVLKELTVIDDCDSILNEQKAEEAKEIGFSELADCTLTNSGILLEQAKAYWQVGDWMLLANISQQPIDHDFGKQKIAALIAMAYYQLNQVQDAQQWLTQAKKWGASNDFLVRTILSSIFNSLARRNQYFNQTERSIQQYSDSLDLLLPKKVGNIFSATRYRLEMQCLKATQDIFSNTNDYPETLLVNNVLGELGKSVCGDNSRMEALKNELEGTYVKLSEKEVRCGELEIENEQLKIDINRNQVRQEALNEELRKIEMQLRVFKEILLDKVLDVTEKSAIENELEGQNIDVKPFSSLVKTSAVSNSTLLDRYQKNWYLGNWYNLLEITPEHIFNDSGRVSLALYAAIGRFQLGEKEEATSFVKLAMEWGADKKQVMAFLLEGIYNNIIQSMILSHKKESALINIEEFVKRYSLEPDVNNDIVDRFEKLNALLMPSDQHYSELKSGMRTANSGLYDLIDDLPSDIVMAEIGCYAGESSSMFLRSSKVDEFHAVDVWRSDWVPYHDETREHIKNKSRKLYDDIDWAFWSFKKRVRGFNVKIHKKTLDEAMHDIPPLDFIYIDGDHSYTGVISDILNAKKLIKESGIIAGHDYCQTYKGTMKAVDQVFGKPDKVYRDNSWVIFPKGSLK